MARADGFYRQADLMTAYTDLAIFRRFLSPNIASLLYAQAEILELWNELRGRIQTDRTSEREERKLFECDWAELKKSLHDPDGGHDKQYHQVMEIRTKLKAYNKALLTLKQLLALPPAEPSALSTLQSWLGLNDGSSLQDWHRKTWNSPTAFDLTSLTGRHFQSDPLSRVINAKLIPFLQAHVFSTTKTSAKVYDSFSRTLEHEPVAYYSDTLIAFIVGVLTTTLTYLIPTSSIFALYFIPSDIARLCAIVGFTAMFAVAVTLTTGSKRVECFTATAAFSAVLVVFISSGSGGGAGGGQKEECKCAG